MSCDGDLPSADQHFGGSGGTLRALLSRSEITYSLWQANVAGIGNRMKMETRRIRKSVYKGVEISGWWQRIFFSFLNSRLSIMGSD